MDIVIFELAEIAIVGKLVPMLQCI